MSIFVRKKPKKTKMTYTCKECGSEDVEGRFWVNLNTCEPDMTNWSMNYENSYYCNNCEEDEIEVEEKEVYI